VSEEDETVQEDDTKISELWIKATPEQREQILKPALEIIEE
jgi:hypothetical protein